MLGMLSHHRVVCGCVSLTIHNESIVFELAKITRKGALLKIYLWKCSSQQNIKLIDSIWV